MCPFTRPLALALLPQPEWVLCFDIALRGARRIRCVEGLSSLKRSWCGGSACWGRQGSAESVSRSWSTMDAEIVGRVRASAEQGDRGLDIVGSDEVTVGWKLEVFLWSGSSNVAGPSVPLELRVVYVTHWPRTWLGHNRFRLLWVQELHKMYTINWICVYTNCEFGVSRGAHLFMCRNELWIGFIPFYFSLRASELRADPSVFPSRKSGNWNSYSNALISKYHVAFWSNSFRKLFTNNEPYFPWV